MAVEKIILDIQAQTAKARKDINNLKTSTKGLNKEVNTTSNLLKKAGSAMLAFASIGMVTKALKDIIKLNMEFEKTLTNVMTLLDKTSKAKFGDFLSAGALNTMQKFGLEVGDVNKALFDTISAGIKAGDSIKFLNEAAKLAVGGVTTLSIAVDGMTSIMNAYKLSIEDANKVASAFFTAQKFGKTTVAELAQNVGMLAPTMKMAGVGFQEMLSAMALLTKQGIQTDMATTSLRATIIALTKTTPATEKIFKSLGIETGITAIKTNGLGATLMQVAKAAQENEDILTQVIPSVRALTAVAAMGEDALYEFDKIVQQVTIDYGEGSAAADAYAIQMATLDKRTDVLKGTMKRLAIEVGNVVKESQRYKESMLAMVGLTELLKGKEAEAPPPSDGGYIGKIFFGGQEGLNLFQKASDVILKEDWAKAIDAYKKMGEEAEGAKPWWELDESELDDRQKKLKKQWDSEGKERIKSITDIQLAITETETNLAKSTTDYDKISAKAKLDYLQQLANEEIEIQRIKSGAYLEVAANTLFAASGFAKQGSGLQKALAIADATISTYLSAQKAFQSFAGIPIVGTALGIAAASGAIAMGLANVAAITAVPTPSFEKGGFTGKSKYQARDKDGRIAGFVHEDEFVFNREKTRTLRPLFEDIHNNRIDIHGLAALTRRGTMKTMPKLNADLLEQQVGNIYRKMSEERQEKPTIIYHEKGYTKQIGNTTINVSN